MLELYLVLLSKQYGIKIISFANENQIFACLILRASLNMTIHFNTMRVEEIKCQMDKQAITNYICNKIQEWHRATGKKIHILEVWWVGDILGIEHRVLCKLPTNEL